MDRPGPFRPQLKATIHRPDASTWHRAHIPWAHCGTSKSPRNYTRTVAHTTKTKASGRERARERERAWTMVSYVSVLLYGVGGIVVAGMALLVAFQEKLVYVPVLPGLTKSYPITPARLRLIYEDVWLRSSDGVRLHAWFIKLLPECRGSFLFPCLLFFKFCFF